jgi:SSS family solute:Na+ symporter
VLAARSRAVIKRNMSALPLYSMLLGMVALLGYCAIAAGVRPLQNASTGRTDTSTIIPVLFDQQFPDWFAGLAFAAIGIGALVPAAIMSIAAANLWTRNIYKEYFKREATPEQEAKQAKIASLVVKFGAIVFIVGIDPQYAIDLQLIGGVLILQTLPAVAISLYTRWFHRSALVIGWIVGMGYGMWMLYAIPNPASGRAHFGGSAYPLSDLGLAAVWEPFAGSTKTIYVGFIALLANLVVAAVVSFLLHRFRSFNGHDATEPADYFADEDDRVAAVVAR